MTNVVRLKEDTETEVLYNDLSKPSLFALSHILRNPALWPKGFIWDYSDCEQCAMGIAHQMWKQVPEIPLSDDPKDHERSGTSLMAHEFSISYTLAGKIFFGRGELLVEHDLEAITPDMVADQIDAYLASSK